MLRHRKDTVVVADAEMGRSRIPRKSGGESISELKGKHCSHRLQHCNVPALKEIKWKKGNIDLGEQELQSRQLLLYTVKCFHSSILGFNSTGCSDSAPECPNPAHTLVLTVEKPCEKRNGNSQSEATWSTSLLCPGKTISSHLRATPGGWRAKAAHVREGKLGELCTWRPSPLREWGIQVCGDFFWPLALICLKLTKDNFCHQSSP